MSEHLLYENKPDYRKEFIVLKGGGWYALEKWNGIPTRWMGADADLHVYSDENQTAMLNFQALSFYRPRTLEIFIGVTLSNRMDIPLNFNKTVMQINLKKGDNAVRLHVLEGCERPLEIPELKNKDIRCLGIAF